MDDVSLAVKLRLNENIVKKFDIDDGNKLETFSHDVDVSAMEENNAFHIEKSGKGNVYYDMNLSYYMRKMLNKNVKNHCILVKVYLVA